MFFSYDVISVSPPPLTSIGAILVTKDFLTGDYKYRLPFLGSVTFDLTTSKITSMLTLMF